MSSTSVGLIIWISVKPVLKLIAIAVAGAILARKGQLSSAVLKGMSSAVINVFMPCLVFSKTVPSFTTDNLGDVGVLLLTAVFYQFCGLIFGLIVRIATPLSEWRNGVLFAGIFSNWGDIPLAFVMTLTTTRPFTTQDQELGVAYISIIIVWCFLAMFPFGGWMLVKRDFEMPLARSDVEARGSRRGVRWLSRVTGISMRRRTDTCIAATNTAAPEEACIVETKALDLQTEDVKLGGTAPELETPRHSTAESIPDLDRIHPARSHVSHVENRADLEDISLSATPNLSLVTPTPMDPLYKRMGRNFLKFLWSVVSPPAIACLLSLLIALVPQLKALLVAAVPGVYMPDAPDGMPPLEWILDIANFGGCSLDVIVFLIIGGACVPTGLVILGASLSTLSLRRGLPPWGSIALMALLKLAVLPVIGVLWTQLLTYHSPLVNQDRKMLRFVMILLSGGLGISAHELMLVPTATTQVVLTQVFAPQGRGAEELNALSAFLISQYIVMLISLTILVAYSLHILY